MHAVQMLQPGCLLWEEVMLTNSFHSHISCNKAQSQCHYNYKVKPQNYAMLFCGGITNITEQLIQHHTL